MSKAIVICPFWGDLSNVGRPRVERFVRWLYEAGYSVVIVRAGARDDCHDTDWGAEITVRDPLGLYGAGSAPSGGARRRQWIPAGFRRWVADTLFLPEPTIVWAARVARSSVVQAAASKASWVLSSSPPESAHVAALRVSRKVSAPLLVDMRDGWVDEPLRPALATSRLRQWFEGRQERGVLLHASRVLVTSDGWQRMLEKRLPFVRGRVRVLTNAYPQKMPEPQELLSSGRSDGRLVLLHSGRFTGSSPSRMAGSLLDVLLSAASSQQPADIVAVGRMRPADEAQIAAFCPRFEAQNWRLRSAQPVAREEALRLIQQADGLLLLSTSEAAVPSKFFEYMAARRPILVLTPRDSAVWRIAKNLRQAYLVDSLDRGAGIYTVREFLRAAAGSQTHYDLPAEFTEQSLQSAFLSHLNRGNQVHDH